MAIYRKQKHHYQYEQWCETGRWGLLGQMHGNMYSTAAQLDPTPTGAGILPTSQIQIQTVHFRFPNSQKSLYAGLSHQCLRL